MEDLQYLIGKRGPGMISTNWKTMFLEEATMLCAKKKDMAKFNMYHLKRTGNPVARLRALNTVQ